MALRSIPRVVQLPGGVKLSGVPFRCVGYDDAGRPKTFEILPDDAAYRATAPGERWVLFASEETIRAPQPERSKVR